jgi:SAM-dependent methyltransferase
VSLGEEAVELSPERMSPADMSGRLVESEHRGRYWWSAALAAGLDVLDAGCGTGYGCEIMAAAGARRVAGVDISESAITEARAAAAQTAAEFVVGSLHALPFPDASFDLAVCFEVIEHIEERDLALLELRRVLRPEGILAVSSPNRDVYPPGNPHHVYEYRPDELREALGAVFPFVRLYRQSPWLAAAVLDDEESRAAGVENPLTTRVIKIAAVEPGRETFSLALACESEVTAPQSLVVLGDPFELRWWHERVEQARVETDDAVRAAELASLRQADAQAALAELERTVHAGLRRAELEVRRRSELEATLAESGRALLAVETELAQARSRLALLESAEADLQEADRRRATAELEDLRNLVGDLEPRMRRAEQTVADMNGSLSWQLTRCLRAAKRLLSSR